MSETVVGRGVLGRRENFKTKRVYVPEWDGDVIIRQLSHRRYAEIQAIAVEAVDVGKMAVKDRSKLSRFGVLLVAASWVDEQGELVLHSEEDYELLANEPDSVLSLLTREIRDFNAMDETAQNEAKKNSGMTLNDAFGIN